MAAPVIFNQSQTADPTTPPLPSGPPTPGAAAAAGSPLHDAVRVAIAAHPDATPMQIAQGLTSVGGVDPQLAQRVVGDVMGNQGSSAPMGNQSQGAGPVDQTTPPGNLSLQPPLLGGAGQDQTTPPVVSGALTPSDAVGTPGQWQTPGAAPAAGGQATPADRTTPPMSVTQGASSPTGSMPSPPTSAAGKANAVRLANMQAAIDKPSPNDYGPTASTANANRLAGLLDQADNPTTPPTGPASPQGNAPAGANPLATTPPLPNFAAMSTPDFAKWMGDQGTPGQGDTDANLPPSGTAPSTQAPGTTPPTVVAGQPQEKASKGPNKWATVLEDLAPAAAALMIGSHNPAAGTAFLSNWQGAQASAQARADQQRQQGVENKVKQQLADAATTKAAAALSSDQMKSLEAAPDGKAALAFYDSIDPSNTKGLRDSFLGADGQPKQWNPYSKDAARISALQQKYGQDAIEKFWKNVNLYSDTPAAQKEIAASYDRQSGSTDFSSALANGTGPSDTAIDKAAREKTLQQRAGTYGDIAKARIKDILASVGLKAEQGKYIDAKTGEVVPLAQAEIKGKQAMADFLSARTGEVVPLAEAEIAYKGAIGAAASENADTNRLAVGVKAALAKEGINVDEARIQQIMGKDPAFSANLQLLKQAIAERQQAQSSATLAQDPVLQKRMVDDIDQRIAMHMDNIKGRINGDGTSSTGVRPASATPVPTVPDVPGIQPKAGKPTARSTAYKNGQVGTGGASTFYRVPLSTGPVTLGKLTAEQYRQLSPADQSVYYHGMQQLKSTRK